MVSLCSNAGWKASKRKWLNGKNLKPPCATYNKKKIIKLEKKNKFSKKKNTKKFFRSQFEKSENNEDNIKTVVDSTSKRDATNAEKGAKEETGGVKGTETVIPKSNLKNPTTPKTPRDKLTPNADIKTKDGESNVKDKIKFSFKSSESVHKAGSSDQAQPSTSTANTSAPHEHKESKAVVCVSNNNGRASSCVIDLKTVWFNFAAPPSVPITRKIDYTRLDWNLLSTASPAITAWMNPSNRFAIKVVAMMKAFHLRRTAIAASIMADGLEVQGIQKHPKVNCHIFDDFQSIFIKELGYHTIFEKYRFSRKNVLCNEFLDKYQPQI